MQRRSTLDICENGVRYKNHSVYWRDIDAVDPLGAIKLKNGTTFVIPASIGRRGEAIDLIRAGVRNAK